MTHHHKPESSCCPLCDQDVQKEGFPFCKPCGVTIFTCPSCKGKFDKDLERCPECGAKIKVK